MFQLTGWQCTFHEKQMHEAVANKNPPKHNVGAAQQYRLKISPLSNTLRKERFPHFNCTTYQGKHNGTVL